MSVQFNQLSDFLLQKMRMTHIYQPVMLIQLLSGGGRATVSDIAKAILVRDPSQVEYYEAITKRFPGKVLTHNRRLTVRDGDRYFLNGFDELSSSEVSRLIEISSERLDQFLKTRVTDPWEHRRKSSGYIPGSKKYEVLKACKISMPVVRHFCRAKGVGSGPHCAPKSLRRRRYLQPSGVVLLVQFHETGLRRHGFSRRRQEVS